MNEKLLLIGLLFVVLVSGCVQEPEEKELEPANNGDDNIVSETKCKPTGQDVQGPFYLPNAPFRNNLAPAGGEGEKLIVQGKVLDTNCSPLSDVVLDIWHTDAGGNYDMSENFLYRGRVRTEADGTFQFETYKFETVRPGKYPLGDSFRPAHIHVKVNKEGYKLLTTQLYFSDDPYLAPNDPCTSCGSDDPTHIIDLIKEDDALEGIFDIVLEGGSREVREISVYN